MYYAGIDYHKRYSFVSIQDESAAVPNTGKEEAGLSEGSKRD